MRPVPLLVALSSLLLISPNSIVAKGEGAGIYAVVDQVTFEPNDNSPNFARISGVFVVPVPMSSGSYLRPQKGYLYFRIAPGTEQATRRDWSKLRAVAGSGKVVSFGEYWVPNPDDPWGNPHHSLEVTVHAEGDSATPDIYPSPQGVMKAVDMVHSANHDPRFDKIAAELQHAKSVLNLPIFPSPIARDHTTLTQALGTVGAFVQDGCVLLGVELGTKDGNEPLVSVNLPPGSHLGDGLRQIMAQIPGYEYELVSEHMINIYPIGAKKDSRDVLNTPVAEFDAISEDPTQILGSPMEYIRELASQLHPGQPYGYGLERWRSNVPDVTLHLKNTTVREILNAASEAMEEFPPQYQPVGWAYLLQPDPSLPAGGKHSWMFVFSAPRNWKQQLR